MKRPPIYSLLALLLGGSGYTVLVCLDWRLAVAVFLIGLAHKLESHEP